MKKIHFLLLIFFIIIFSLPKVHGQTPGEKKVKNIYESLKKVYPKKSSDDYPKLVWASKDSDYVAGYDSSSGNKRIFFGESLYDVCVSRFDDRFEDAIASILAHELSHFDLDHQKSGAFAFTNVKIDESEFETAADMQGLFRATLAGYNVFDIWPELIQTIYQQYNIGKSKTHMSLEERQKLAKEISAQTREIAIIMGIANNLQILSFYEESIQCYQYLLSQSNNQLLSILLTPDIYNNMGVAYLNKVLFALQPKDKNENETDTGLAFAYPIELDPSQRLWDLADIKKSPSQDKILSNEISEYLENAEMIFRDLIYNYPDYTSPYINLTITEIFKYIFNNDPAIDEYISKLEKRYKAQKLDLPPNAYLVRGIYKYLLGKVADQDFDSAKRLGAYEIDYNYGLYKENSSLLAGLSKYIFDFLDLWTSSKNEIEQIVNNDPEKSPYAIHFHGKNVVDTLEIGSFKEQVRKIFIHETEDGDSFITVSLKDKTILFEFPSQESSIRDVQSGDNKNIVFEKFHNEPNEVAAFNGSFLQYDFKQSYVEDTSYSPPQSRLQSSGVIFQIIDDQVNSWVKYIIEYSTTTTQ